MRTAPLVLAISIVVLICAILYDDTGGDVGGSATAPCSFASIPGAVRPPNHVPVHDVVDDEAKEEAATTTAE
jgi:hypothetical protein